MASVYDDNYGYLSKFTKFKISRKVDDLCVELKKIDTKKSTLVEIGCGTGEYTKLLGERLPNYKILASDISSGMLEVAKQKCNGAKNVSFLKNSAYDLKNIKSGTVDVVVGFYILHHLDEANVWKEIKRVLKPGGVAMFWEPNIINPYVYMVKSVPFLKKKAGDSPDEWAINPIKYRLSPPKGFFCLISTTHEYYPQFINFAYKTQLTIDDFLCKMGRLPGLNLLGGSVFLCLRKR